MASEFEHKLRPRAEAFIQALSQSGFAGELLEHTFQGYSVKVAISQNDKRFGNAVIHYSPKKSSFTLAQNELKDKSIMPEVENCWYGKHVIPPESSKTDSNTSAKAEYHIYVDGSFLNDIVGYGAVVVKQDNMIEEFSGSIINPAIQEMHQVGGEIEAVKKAIKWCQENSINEVCIFYDYENLKKWATGENKANKVATQEYAEFIKNCGINIQWNKVKSHSGDRWNNWADELAKKGSTPDRTDVNTSTPQNLEAELQAKALLFVEFLANKQIQADFERVVNSNCAKIKIFHQGRSIGYFNLYHTSKKSFSPKCHEIREKDAPHFKEHLEGLWEEFICEKPLVKQDILKQVRYYHSIFEPYKKCDFDFIDFARAISKVFELLKKPPLVIEQIRYNFIALEKIYQELQESYHE